VPELIATSNIIDAEILDIREFHIIPEYMYAIRSEPCIRLFRDIL